MQIYRVLSKTAIKSIIPEVLHTAQKANAIAAAKLKVQTVQVYNFYTNTFGDVTLFTF